MYQSKFWLWTYWISLGAYPSFKEQVHGSSKPICYLFVHQLYFFSLWMPILLHRFIQHYLVFCHMLFCWWCPSYLMQQAQPMLKFSQLISPLLVCWIFISIFSMRKGALDFPTLCISVSSTLFYVFLLLLQFLLDRNKFHLRQNQDMMQVGLGSLGTHNTVHFKKKGGLQVMHAWYLMIVTST